MMEMQENLYKQMQMITFSFICCYKYPDSVPSMAEPVGQKNLWHLQDFSVHYMQVLIVFWLPDEHS